MQWCLCTGRDCRYIHKQRNNGVDLVKALWSFFGKVSDLMMISIAQPSISNTVYEHVFAILHYMGKQKIHKQAALLTSSWLPKLSTQQLTCNSLGPWYRECLMLFPTSIVAPWRYGGNRTPLTCPLDVMQQQAIWERGKAGVSCPRYQLFQGSFSQAIEPVVPC